MSDVHPEVGQEAWPSAAHPLPSTPALSPRQRAILRLLGKGKSTAAIAVALGVTPSAITYHRARMRHRLGLRTEWDLVRFAILAPLVAAEHDRKRGRGNVLTSL